MLQDSKRSLKAIKKELKHFSKEYSNTENEYIYEYLMMLDSRYKRIKNGSKGI